MFQKHFFFNVVAYSAIEIALCLAPCFCPIMLWWISINVHIEIANVSRVSQRTPFLCCHQRGFFLHRYVPACSLLLRFFTISLHSFWELLHNGGFTCMHVIISYAGLVFVVWWFPLHLLQTNLVYHLFTLIFFLYALVCILNWMHSKFIYWLLTLSCREIYFSIPLQVSLYFLN